MQRDRFDELRKSGLLPGDSIRSPNTNDRRMFGVSMVSVVLRVLETFGVPGVFGVLGVFGVFCFLDGSGRRCVQLGEVI